MAICTLSSIDLLQEISKSDIMEGVAIAGRLLSENKGIDAMIRFAAEHPDLKRIILCGKEVKGHRAGQALLALARNGIDSQGRIMGALGPYPILKSSIRDIDAFRRQVEIMDMVGTTDINSLKSACRGWPCSFSCILPVCRPGSCRALATPARRNARCRSAPPLRPPCQRARAFSTTSSWSAAGAR